MTLNIILLIVGSVMVFLAGLEAMYEYQIYVVGRPEQTRDTIIGNIYLPEIPPNDPGVKASAYAGFAVAGAGILLCGFSLAIIAVDRFMQQRGEHDPLDAETPTGDLR